jgi:hypothetical protein
MKNVLIMLAFAAPMAFSWGNMETMETKSYPAAPDLVLEFAGANVDISFHEGTELRITNNEFTDPDFPLSVSEGRCSFDAAAYRESRKAGSGNGEKPKYIVRLPATTERVVVRADRVRLRPELIAQARPAALKELAISGISIELRDIDPLPARIALDAEEIVLRDSAALVCAVELRRSCSLRLHRLSVSELSFEGAGTVRMEGHRVDAEAVSVSPGLRGAAELTDSRVGAWNGPDGFAVSMEGKR